MIHCLININCTTDSPVNNLVDSYIFFFSFFFFFLTYFASALHKTTGTQGLSAIIGSLLFNQANDPCCRIPLLSHCCILDNELFCSDNKLMKPKCDDIPVFKNAKQYDPFGSVWICALFHLLN